MAVLTLLTLSHQRRYYRHFGRLRLIRHLLPMSSLILDLRT